MVGSSNHAQRGQWNCTAAKMVQRFEENCHIAFKRVSALSRGILKQKKGKTSIHFKGDSINTELLFKIIHSVNQLSFYGAGANRCQQFDLAEEEKGRSNLSVDESFLTSVPPHEVQLLESHATVATGNSLQVYIECTPTACVTYIRSVHKHGH